MDLLFSRGRVMGALELLTVSLVHGFFKHLCATRSLPQDSLNKKEDIHRRRGCMGAF